MSELKTFRISGSINKRQFFTPMTFNREVRAAKQEMAVERIYNELGSRHRAKRSQISILTIEEVAPQKGE